MKNVEVIQHMFGIDKKKLGPTYYDPVTKQIINAEEGSLVWWHEKGHMEFEKKPELMNKDFSRQSMHSMVVFFTVATFFWNFLKWLALGFLIANIYYAVYEEVWCWNYGIKKYKKQEAKRPRPEVLRYIKFA